MGELFESRAGWLGVLAGRHARIHRLEFADARQEAAIAFVRAVRKYDPSRGRATLTSYLWVAVPWHLARRRKNRPTASGHDTLSWVAAPAPEPDHPLAWTLAGALGRLKPRLRHVVARHYGLDGEPAMYREIAAEMGVHFTRVGQLHDEALDNLRESISRTLSTSP